MNDPIAIAARAAAARLGGREPGVAADVEAALALRDTGQRPSQYIDLVSLGTLIVAIATLAWTVYNDQRKKTPDPPSASVARQVRIELRQRETGPHDTERLTKMIVTEIVQAAHDQDDAPGQAG